MTAKVVETIEDVRVVVRLTDRTCPENGKDTVEWIRRHDLVSRIMQLLGAADINAHVLLEYDRVSRCSACGDRYEEIRYSAEDTDGPTGLGCANCGEIHKPDAAWLETESLRTTGEGA